MEKGIIFTTDMVQAILAGTKTQTRRVIKKLPHCPVHGVDPYLSNGYLMCKGCDHFATKSKYQVGDILYVKETWNESFRDNACTQHASYLYRATEKNMMTLNVIGVHHDLCRAPQRVYSYG